MMNKQKSTFDRLMSDSEQKKKFEKEYVQFLFSELLLEAMDEEHISVREPALPVNDSCTVGLKCAEVLGWQR